MPRRMGDAPAMPPGWGVAYLDRFVWDGDTGYTLWPDTVVRCYLAGGDAEAGAVLREQMGNAGCYHSGEWMDRGHVSMAYDGMVRGGKGLEIAIDGYRELWSWTELGAIARRNLRSGRWPNAGQYHIRARYGHIAKDGDDDYPHYDDTEAWMLAYLHPTCYPPEGARCLLPRRASWRSISSLVVDSPRQMALF